MITVQEFWKLWILLVDTISEIFWPLTTLVNTSSCANARLDILILCEYCWISCQKYHIVIFWILLNVVQCFYGLHSSIITWAGGALDVPVTRRVWQGKFGAWLQPPGRAKITCKSILRAKPKILLTLLFFAIITIIRKLGHFTYIPLTLCVNEFTICPHSLSFDSRR